ncbi:MAG TPA: DUF4157 domain-containing protein [Vicingaceae bacterium]
MKQAIQKESSGEKRNHNSKKDSPANVAFTDNRPEATTQLKVQQMANQPIQRQENKTGMPDNLKSGIENLSGMDMSDVKVHYNSSQPAQLQAHAFAQGNQIHIASGQEKHLPHEAWHVVQQKQGRVTPTKQLKGKVNINDDSGLEKEADVMGAKALQGKFKSLSFYGKTTTNTIVQRAMKTDVDLDGIIDGRGYYRWAGLRTGLVNDLGGHKKAEGFEAGIHGTAKTLKTLIKWGQPTQATGFEGISMNAERLGPDHKLGSPPASNGIWSVRRKDFSTLSGKRYIAGHLLNDNLGGPGNQAENLTAIPSSANSEHSDKIEETIKEKVNKHGEWMHYSVNIGYGVVDNVNPHNLGYTTGTAANKKLKAKQQGKYEDGTAPNTVKIRYADSLKAKWGPLDEDGNKTGSTEGKSISINTPTLGTSDAAANLQGNPLLLANYDADIKVDGVSAEARSAIGHEHLVLTNTSDIRAAHSARAPVVEHHHDFEDKATADIEALTDEKAALTLQVQQLQQQLQTRTTERNEAREERDGFRTLYNFLKHVLITQFGWRP